VQREMLEETHLEVSVVRLLLDEPDDWGSLYKRQKTYLCEVREGEAQPGHEPEAVDLVSILEVGWFDLRDESTWGDQVRGDLITFPLLERIRSALGYA
jgi:8-oxo-dGTP pyrophosphatase MutT (NUDIX family)